MTRTLERPAVRMAEPLMDAADAHDGTRWRAGPFLTRATIAHAVRGLKQINKIIDARGSRHWPLYVRLDDLAHVFIESTVCTLPPFLLS